MPILWGDRLVGRFDPKLDRTTGTLVILGLWLEDDALARDAAFADALAAGMRRFMTLLDVRRIDVAAVTPAVAPAPARAVGHATRPLVGQLTATSRLSDWAVAGRRATTTRTTPQASTSAAAPSIAAPSPAPTETKPMSGG